MLFRSDPVLRRRNSRLCLPCRALCGGDWWTVVRLSPCLMRGREHTQDSVKPFAHAIAFKRMKKARQPKRTADVECSVTELNCRNFIHVRKMLHKCTNNIKKQKARYLFRIYCFSLGKREIQLLLKLEILNRKTINSG